MLFVVSRLKKAYTGVLDCACMRLFLPMRAHDLQCIPVRSSRQELLHTHSYKLPKHGFLIHRETIGSLPAARESVRGTRCISLRRKVVQDPALPKRRLPMGVGTHTLTVLNAPAFRRYSPMDRYALGRGLPASVEHESIDARERNAMRLFYVIWGKAACHERSRFV